jgi:hypothetical protein
MIQALVVAALMVVPGQAVQSSQSYCRQARQMLNANLPPKYNTAETEIAHSAVAYVGDQFAGFLYVTKGGRLWLQTGKVGTMGTVVSKRNLLAIGSAMGIESDNLASGSFYSVSSGHLEATIANVVSIVGCY